VWEPMGSSIVFSDFSRMIYAPSFRNENNSIDMHFVYLRMRRMQAEGQREGERVARNAEGTQHW
jgi:hypothetical protein